MLSCVARPDLGARCCPTIDHKPVALIALAIIRVCASVSAAAKAARISRTVVNVYAGLAVATEARWAGAAAVAKRWRRQVVTGNASEARCRCTVVLVGARHSVTGVACAACAAVASWSLMVADRVGVAVMLSCVARPDLGARCCSSRINIDAVASIALTRVLTDSSIDAVAI